VGQGRGRRACQGGAGAAGASGSAGGGSHASSQAQTHATAGAGPSGADVRCSEDDEAAAAAGRFLAAPWAHQSREAAGLEGPGAGEGSEAEGGEGREERGSAEGACPPEGRGRRGAQGRNGKWRVPLARGPQGVPRQRLPPARRPEQQGEGTEDSLSEGGWQGLTSAEAREASAL